MDTDVEDPSDAQPSSHQVRCRARGRSLLTGAAAALSACSAGQITQTDNQVAAVPGINASSADGKIKLRNVMVVYAAKVPAEHDDPAGPAAGQRRPQVARLTGAVTADGNGQVVLVGGASSASSPTPAASRRPRPRGRPRPRRSASPAGSASPSPAASPSPTGVGSAQLNVEVPGTQLIVLSPSQDGASYLAITGRSSELVPGQTVGVNFTFTYADGSTTTLSADLPVGTPLSPPTQEPPASAAE